jgi:hypothetical protein
VGDFSSVFSFLQRATEGGCAEQSRQTFFLDKRRVPSLPGGAPTEDRGGNSVEGGAALLLLLLPPLAGLSGQLSK